jgi:hypothetical protein
MTPAAIFDDIRLGWKGVPFLIPANRIMGALARVEDIVTLDELQRFAVRKTAPMAKLSMAYGSLLRYAGCFVSDEAVYSEMVRSDDGAAVMTAINGLMSMMLPPVRDEDIEKKEAPSGNSPSAAKSSKRSRLRSGRGSSRRKNSGRSIRANSGGSSKPSGLHSITPEA